MASKYLMRDDASFGDDIWARLDEVVLSVAKSQLSGRKLLDVEGPYGLSLKSVPLQDELAVDAEVKLISSQMLPVPLLETFFSLSPRDLAAFEQSGFSFDTGTIAEAGMNIAAAEDGLIFQGNKALEIDGLMTGESVQMVDLGNWDEIGTAANDIIKAVNSLDAAGFHGPYLLALSPKLHNLLYRLYPQGYQIEIQHIMSIVGSEVIKAPGLKTGGVLLAEGKQFASIVIGQDMSTGFVGPEDSGLKFKITESLVPKIRVPASICVLNAV